MSSINKEVSKAEFLKRYLENEAESEKKRKKKLKHVKTKANVPCLKIIDKDIDLKSVNFDDKEEDEGEEAPVVAEVIDERPLEVKLKELYESSRWKKISNNESSQSDQAVLENVSNERNARNRHDSDSDISPMRRQKRHSDSDISPPRNHKQIKRRRDSDSDISPPRTHSKIKKGNKHDSYTSLVHHQSANTQRNNEKNSSRRHDSDSDTSPPRHQSANKHYSQIKHSSRRHDSDNDHSPVRNKSYSQRKGRNSDSDLSPPRSPSELSSVKGKSMKLGKTLSGLKAGLQNSKALQQEVQEMRKREKSALNMLDDDISGRNAGTVIRDKKTGLKKDLNKAQEAKNEENKKAKEYQQKYDKWGKGIEQKEGTVKKIEDEIYEMSKPLARYKDDEDLEERLKSIVHDDDPMKAYIKKKQQKNVPDYPVYSGPPAPPNRFGIMPGYRWDGVDRSNGFEKKYFDKINTTKAVQDEAYLWSIQDM